MSETNIVESLRGIVQDLLVPEVKEIKAEIAALRTDKEFSNNALRTKLTLRLEASDRHTEPLIRALFDKLDFTTEVRERLASNEARMARQ